jgi:hypothetical protein
MKTRLIINITASLLIGISSTFSQEEIPWTVKERLINQLDSADVWGTINSIEDYNIIEAKEKIEQVFWNSNIDRSNQYSLLDLLYKFGSNLTHQYALAYIDTLEINPFGNNTTGLSKLYYQVATSEILMKFGDYSKASLVFEYLQYEYPKISFTEISILEKLLNNVPQYSEAAKIELQRAVREASINRDRYYALEVLYNHNQQETVPLMKQMFLEDENPTNRFWVLDSLVHKFKDEEVHILLKQQLYSEPDYIVRYEIATNLIHLFSSITDYKFVIDYLPNESNLEVKDYLALSIQWFKPLKPDSNQLINVVLGDLISLTDSCAKYNWLNDQSFNNELKNILLTAKTNLLSGDSLACKVQVKAFQDLVDNVYKDSLNPDPRFVTIEGWKFLYWNAQYILERLPEPPANPNLVVSLKSSTGTLLTTGSLQYYEGSWKDAVSNGDGTFTVITNQNNVSLRMTYEYAQQTVNNIPAHNNTYTFQTVSANVQLKNSLGTLIDTGSVQYYAGAWRSFGSTTNGVATKELLPINYSFRMTYAYASIDKQQNLSVDPTVVFQTVNAQVQLKNSLGNFQDVGTVQYYAGAWRNFGTTVNGVATKELLPINYSFRMTYAFASIDKQQNLSVDPVVVFQTVNAAVQLKNSLGNLIDQGTVQYYAGAWRTFGITTNGVAIKELLPINYSFRMTYAYASIDKQQNLSVDPVVVFQTVNAQAQLKNSLGNLIDLGTVQYYAGAWRSFGTTTNGVAAKELLPINYSFRMTYEYASIDKQQNLSSDPIVVFQTVNAQVQLKNSLGNLIDQGAVQYYAGAWRSFGTTTNGVATKELLPINYSFRMTHAFLSKDKQQNLSTNPVVDFQTVLCTVKVTNSANQPLNNAAVKYYAGAWRDFGATNASGITTKELLPQNISFRASYGTTSVDKQQDITTNNLVEILLNIP